MDLLFVILKGAALGLSSLVPGFSVGTMAIILGIYQKTIVSVSQVLRSPFKGNKKEWGFLLSLGFGTFLTVISLSDTLGAMIQSYSLYGLLIYSFVLGMLVAPCPYFFKNAKILKVDKYLSVKIVLILFFSIIIPLLINMQSDCIHCGVFQGRAEEGYLGMRLLEWLVVGVLSGVFSILPGLSGALVLLIFGKYIAVLQWLGSIRDIKGVLSHDGRIFQFSDVAEMLIGAHFILGLAVGAILTIIALKCFFSHNKRKDILYSLILGLMIASIILFLEQYEEYLSIFFGEDFTFLNVETVIMFLFICLGVGTYATLKRVKVPTQ